MFTCAFGGLPPAQHAHAQVCVEHVLEHLEALAALWLRLVSCTKIDSRRYEEVIPARVGWRNDALVHSDLTALLSLHAASSVSILSSSSAFSRRAIAKS